MTVFIVEWEWFSPISLPTEDGIAQAKVDLDATQSLGFHISFRSGNGFLHGFSIQREIDIGRSIFARRIANHAFFCIKTLFAHIASLYQRDNRQIKMPRKGIVATIVGRHGHNRPGSVTGKDIIAHPDRNGFTGKRVNGPTACKDARHLSIGDAFALRALLGFFNIGGHGCLLVRRSKLFNEFAFRGEHDEGHAENRICTCGKDGYLFVATLHAKLHLCAF